MSSLKVCGAGLRQVPVDRLELRRQATLYGVAEAFLELARARDWLRISTSAM